MINQQIDRVKIYFFIKQNNIKFKAISKMSKSPPNQTKKRHKSQFNLLAKSSIRQYKQKRTSCMSPQQFMQIEESSSKNINLIIQTIISSVFNTIDQAKQIGHICIKQLQQKVILIDNLDIYNMSQQIGTQASHQIILESQPKIQPKHKVIQKKQKQDIISIHRNQTDKLLLPSPQLNSSKTNKFLSKQKLTKLGTSIYGGTSSTKSIKSIKSNRGINKQFTPFKIAGRIQQQKQSSKSKQKRQKQQIVKKLMRQYQNKLRQSKHFGPQPIECDYRSFFTQPEPRQLEDLRSSFLHLRQLKQQQLKQLTKKSKKSTLKPNQSIVSNPNTGRTTKLPTLYKQSNSQKQQNKIALFTQDQNGKVIRIKNQQRLDTMNRQHSLTTHDCKPHQTALRQISNTVKVKYEYLKNDKIKLDQFNQNCSVVSTLCQSMDQQILQKSILQNFKQKPGILLKKQRFSHRVSMSGQLDSIKLPAIHMGKR